MEVRTITKRTAVISLFLVHGIAPYHYRTRQNKMFDFIPALMSKVTYTNIINYQKIKMNGVNRFLSHGSIAIVVAIL
jgi:hypothetical protein